MDSEKHFGDIHTPPFRKNGLDPKPFVNKDEKCSIQRLFEQILPWRSIKNRILFITIALQCYYDRLTGSAFYIGTIFNNGE